MYLVSYDRLQRPVNSSPAEMQAKRYIRRKKKQRRKQHPYDKWVTFRERMQEKDAGLKMRIKMLSDFVKKLPTTSEQEVTPAQTENLIEFPSTSKTDMAIKTDNLIEFPSTSESDTPIKTVKKRAISSSKKM
jgi:hypothetical protein